MTLRIEGFAIISGNGMLADATGAMPSALVIEADQRFLSHGLDQASVIVHGRNSHENQARSPQRRRLIATRTIESIAPAPDQPKALLWNPAGLSLDMAAEVLGVRHGTIAILGGTELFGLFLPRYDVFYLSRLPGLHLSGGRPVFPQVPQRSAKEVLASSKLTQAAQRPLDVARGVTLATWVRKRIEVAA
jgi:dihydrofolate reductase